MSYYPRVTNICGKVSLNCELNLENILGNHHFKTLTRKKYNPRRFSGLISKYMETKLTFLIFKNGKIIITGAKTIREMNEAMMDLGFELYLLENVMEIPQEVIITNICASVNVGHTIDLVRLKELHPFQSDYEYELFANLKYRKDGLCFTVCRSGVLFVCGIKDINKVNNIFNDCINEIKLAFI